MNFTTAVFASTVAILGLSALPALAGDPPFQVCNKTGGNVNVAIAYWSLGSNFGQLISKGWWVIAPGGCAQLFGDDSADSHRLYRAEAAVGNDVWEGFNKWLCVDDNSTFDYNNYSNGGECPAGWSKKGFRTFGDKDLDLAE